MLVLSPERTKYCMLAGTCAEAWATYNRQEQKGDEIVNLFHQRDSKTTLMRND